MIFYHRQRKKAREIGRKAKKRENGRIPGALPNQANARTPRCFFWGSPCMEKSVKLYVANGNFAEADIAAGANGTHRVAAGSSGNLHTGKSGAVGRLHPELVGDDQLQLAEGAVQGDGAVRGKLLAFLKIGGHVSEAHIRAAAG